MATVANGVAFAVNGNSSVMNGSLPSFQARAQDEIDFYAKFFQFEKDILAGRRPEYTLRQTDTDKLVASLQRVSNSSLSSTDRTTDNNVFSSNSTLSDTGVSAQSTSYSISLPSRCRMREPPPTAVPSIAQFDPSLLQKSDKLLQAEAHLRLQREQKTVKELTDKRKDIERALKVSAHAKKDKSKDDTLNLISPLHLNGGKVLETALTLVKPISGIEIDADVNEQRDNSPFDDEYYSSRGNSWSPQQRIESSVVVEQSDQPVKETDEKAVPQLDGATNDIVDLPSRSRVSGLGPPKTTQHVPARVNNVVQDADGGTSDVDATEFTGDAESDDLRSEISRSESYSPPAADAFGGDRGINKSAAPDFVGTGLKIQNQNDAQQSNAHQSTAHQKSAHQNIAPQINAHQNASRNLAHQSYASQQNARHNNAHQVSLQNAIISNSTLAQSTPSKTATRAQESASYRPPPVGAATPAISHTNTFLTDLQLINNEQGQLHIQSDAEIDSQHMRGSSRKRKVKNKNFPANAQNAAEQSEKRKGKDKDTRAIAQNPAKQNQKRHRKNEDITASAQNAPQQNQKRKGKDKDITATAQNSTPQKPPHKRRRLGEDIAAEEGIVQQPNDLGLQSTLTPQIIASSPPQIKIEAELTPGSLPVEALEATYKRVAVDQGGNYYLEEVPRILPVERRPVEMDSENHNGRDGARLNPSSAVVSHHDRVGNQQPIQPEPVTSSDLVQREIHAPHSVTLPEDGDDVGNRHRGHQSLNIASDLENGSNVYNAPLAQTHSSQRPDPRVSGYPPYQHDDRYDTAMRALSHPSIVPMPRQRAPWSYFDEQLILVPASLLSRMVVLPELPHYRATYENHPYFEDSIQHPLQRRFIEPPQRYSEVYQQMSHYQPQNFHPGDERNEYFRMPLPSAPLNIRKRPFQAVNEDTDQWQPRYPSRVFSGAQQQVVGFTDNDIQYQPQGFLPRVVSRDQQQVFDPAGAEYERRRMPPSAAYQPMPKRPRVEPDVNYEQQQRADPQPRASSSQGHFPQYLANTRITFDDDNHDPQEESYRTAERRTGH